MANAARDESGKSTLLGALSTDGKTPVRVKADPTVHTLKVVDAQTGSDHGRSVAVLDENGVPVLLAVSSVDGLTPVEVYADSNGNLLIDSA